MLKIVLRFIKTGVFTWILKQIFSHQDAIPHDQGSSWNIEASDGEVLGKDPQVAIGGW
jgi:hypothetical protein